MSENIDVLHEVMTGMRADLKDIKQDVRQLRIDTNKIGIETSTNSRALDEHMRRTEASETRLSVVETHMITLQAAIHSGVKIVATVGSCFIFLKEILPLIQKLFIH